jgi:hypothetical protein
MKRAALLLFVLLAIQAWPVLAQAQDSPSLSSLEIALWPEFDRPEVLVMLEGFFAPETSLPLQVELRIPARVGQPHAVAYVSDGQLLELEPVSRQEGEWLVVGFELPTLGFHLEYYDDQLSIRTDGSREFAFSYQPDYPVAELSFRAQVPPDADSFALEPAAESVTTGDYGLDYHTAEMDAVEEGQELAWTLSYERASSVLTENILFPDSTPVPPAPVEEDQNSTLLIFLVGFVATLAIGAGAFWLGRRTQPLAKPVPGAPRKRRGGGRGRSTDRPQVPSSDGEEPLFCYRCGTELREGTDFCHRCGAEARR